MESYGVVDATKAFVRVYLPKHHWHYLLWLKSQGLDFDRFTQDCDKRRRQIGEGSVLLPDFLEVVTERLANIHYRPYADRSNVVQPVLIHQLSTAIDKAEAYFRNSGPNATRWNSWTGHHTN